MTKSPTQSNRNVVKRFALPLKDKAHEYIRKFNYSGLLLGTLFFCVSTLPSLLPRPPLFQGLISGISIAIGYGIGVALSTSIRWLIEAEPKIVLKRYAWIGLAIIAPILIIIFLIASDSWQNEVRRLVGENEVGGHHIATVVAVATITWLVILTISRIIRRITVFLSAQLDKILPHRLSIALGMSIVFILLFWVFSGLFAEFFISSTNTIYEQKNKTTPDGVSQPTSSYKSGSPESLIPWETLGYQGKAFTGRGPDQKQLTEFSGKPSKPPIRIYAGLDSANNPADRARLAVEDLKRTKAFQRPVLVLATATGTGWLEPQSVDALEYMYNGNSAIVTQQYSYLPSWISFLVDKQKATEAGQALYDAIYGELLQMPENERPQLIAYGLSLGSFGGQTPYAGVNDFRYSIDGALFVGTPSDTQLWRTITNDRNEGSPEWQPTYQNGATVKYAATNDDIVKDQTQWEYPRLLYLQHGSDPVVWFSFDLLFKEPDWLKETRGPDVSPATQWYPFVTFLQVTVDQFFGVTVPNGHGHNYSDTMVQAWASVTNPEGWTAEDTARLQEIIAPYKNE